MAEGDDTHGMVGGRQAGWGGGSPEEGRVEEGAGAAAGAQQAEV